MINGTYLIFVEAEGSYVVFSDHEIRKAYETIFSMYEKRFAFSVLSYKYSGTMSLAVLKITNVPTSKIMQCVLTRFSKYLNSRFSLSGKKLKDRYRAFLIKTEYL